MVLHFFLSFIHCPSASDATLAVHPNKSRSTSHSCTNNRTHALLSTEKLCTAVNNFPPTPYIVGICNIASSISRIISLLQIHKRPKYMYSIRYILFIINYLYCLPNRYLTPYYQHIIDKVEN